MKPRTKPAPRPGLRLVRGHAVKVRKVQTDQGCRVRTFWDEHGVEHVTMFCLEQIVE